MLRWANGLNMQRELVGKKKKKIERVASAAISHYLVFSFVFVFLQFLRYLFVYESVTKLLLVTGYPYFEYLSIRIDQNQLLFLGLPSL